MPAATEMPAWPLLEPACEVSLGAELPTDSPVAVDTTTPPGVDVEVGGGREVAGSPIVTSRGRDDAGGEGFATMEGDATLGRGSDGLSRTDGGRRAVVMLTRV